MTAPGEAGGAVVSEAREVGGEVVVRLLVPAALAEATRAPRRLEVALPGPGTLADVLGALASTHPVLARRLCDETGALRRYVNAYVDGVDVRTGQGAATPVRTGCDVQVLASVAGG